MVDELHFPPVILTLYRIRDIPFSTVLEFVQRHPRISAMTMPISLFTEEKAAQLLAVGVQTFVHTVNDPAQACFILGQGASGIYTDVLFDELETEECGPAHGVSRFPVTYSRALAKSIENTTGVPCSPKAQKVREIARQLPCFLQNNWHPNI